MFRGVEFSIRFSAEQKNKLFSPCTTFFEVQQNWHKTQFSQFSIASIELGVGWFFVSAIIRSGWHVKSQIRISSLVHVFWLEIGVSWVLHIYCPVFSIVSCLSRMGVCQFVSYFVYDST